MFENLLRYPIESPLLKWESKMVVRDHQREPRLFLRLHLTGTKFPLFDATPFVRVGKVRARFVEIAEDGLSVKAYFEEAPSEDAPVEFGYDDQPLLRFPNPYRGERVLRLDEDRLPRTLRYQDRFFQRSIE